jgi:hypothetical protein
MYINTFLKYTFTVFTLLLFVAATGYITRISLLICFIVGKVGWRVEDRLTTLNAIAEEGH